MKLVQRLSLYYVRKKLRVLAALSKRRAARAAFELFCTPQRRVDKPLPAIFLKAEQLSFLFAGETVRGFRWNHPAPKKALILHGFESGVVNFDGYVRPLTEKGYEVLAFDAPAHGQSSGKTINVLLYKNMIEHICALYGPVNSFLAHSLGGLSAALALEAMPHDAQTKLVLIAPATETTRAMKHFFQIVQLDESVRDSFNALIFQIGKQPPEWYSVNRAADHLQAQVLFIQDEDDQMTPLADVQPLINKHLPNFRFHITKGLGHRRIYRDAQIKKEIIDFL